jgi:hypothetical protein
MEHKFELAKKVIEIISDCNGCVYGNFVRDVIVPRMDDPRCEISFDNISFYFNDLANKNSAIDKIRKNCRYETDYDNYLTKYKILDDNIKLLFKIKFIVSRDYSDKNFDVNSVKFRYSNGLFQCVNCLFLIDKIRNKQATIVKSYIPTSNLEFEKINKAFFEKGWIVSSEEKQHLLSKWIVKNDIHVLISYENERWNYCPTKTNNESKYGLDIAKKIIGIASLCDSYVHGEFVRDVIIPRMNNPDCEISFENIDIWCKDLTRRDLFFNKLNIYFSLAYNVPYFMNYENQYKYDINGKSVNINIIVSENFHGKYFDINSVIFKYLDNEFVCKYLNISIRNKNKQTIMNDEYNPTSDLCFNQINKDFFQKGWSILSKNQQTDLAKWIVQYDIPVLISFEDGYWIFSPNKNKAKNEITKNEITKNKSKDEITKNEITKNEVSKEAKNEVFKEAKNEVSKEAKDEVSKEAKDEVSKEVKDEITKDDKSKDILMSIFNTGLEVLGGKLYNNIEDTELQYIYKCGLDEYRNKFNHVLENYNKK